MERFLIRLDHDSEPIACARVVETFLRTGSHYLTHADWGCSDGVHSAWLIVDAESREEARQVVPPPFRAEATVVKLNKFTIERLDEAMRSHPAWAARRQAAAAAGA
jgi:hypothetical protein